MGRYERTEHQYNQKSERNTSNANTDGKISNDTNDKENIHVPDAYKASAGLVSVGNTNVIICAPSAGLREYNVNCVLKDDTTQSKAFDIGASNIVCQFLNGINGTIFMFGQTGSGKTHTMFGPDDKASSDVTGATSTRGMLPRAFGCILDHCDFLRNNNVQCELKFAYVEVLGNEVINLLEEGTTVGAWSGVAARSVLEGNASLTVRSKKEAEALLIKGDSNKRRAATEMNERSTRAHSVMMFDLIKIVDDIETHSQLVMADLGGSEQLKKSKAVGEELSNAIKINSGLLALKQCIDAVNQQKAHVPYVASTLTQLLSGALGGHSRSSLVVTCSMASHHAAETMHALDFGMKSMNIVNKTDRYHNMRQGFAAIDAINTRLKELEEEIQRSERWENKVVVRQDLEGEERQLVSVLVGAEHLRKEYESLIARKLELVGC